MSAIARALNPEAPTEWVEPEVVVATPSARWGAPIWAADEAIVAPGSKTLEARSLEITLLAFLRS